MDLECHHNTYTFGDATFGDIQVLVTDAMVHHHCSYAMVMVTIHHYKSLLVMNLNVTITPILLATPPLVTISFWWQRLWSITMAHMKWWRSLFVIINHYCWRTLYVTTTPILLVMPPLVTFIFWWWMLFWPSPMSLWWHFSPLTNVLFSCSGTRKGL